MQIIDGYTGAPNIYADDIGQYNISLFGNGDYVLPVGEQQGYELVSNNEIKIKDGFFITQGRRGVIKKGTTESCIIENGTQAENRNDLIIIEYAKDESSLVESHTMKVIKGTPGETAADPTTITGNIPNGAVLHQMPLYRVKLEGLNIVAVEPLFSIGKIAPETVDPMLATEEGFAADAMLTGNELKSLNSKIYSSKVIYSGNYVMNEAGIGYLPAPEIGLYRYYDLCMTLSSGGTYVFSCPWDMLKDATASTAVLWSSYNEYSIGVYPDIEKKQLLFPMLVLNTSVGFILSNLKLIGRELL